MKIPLYVFFWHSLYTYKHIVAPFVLFSYLMKFVKRPCVVCSSMEEIEMT